MAKNMRTAKRRWNCLCNNKLSLFLRMKIDSAVKRIVFFQCPNLVAKVVCLMQVLTLIVGPPLDTHNSGRSKDIIFLFWINEKIFDVEVTPLPATNHKKVQDHSPDEDFISPVCQIYPVLWRAGVDLAWTILVVFPVTDMVPCVVPNQVGDHKQFVSKIFQADIASS